LETLAGAIEGSFNGRNSDSRSISQLRTGPDKAQQSQRWRAGLNGIKIHGCHVRIGCEPAHHHVNEMPTAVEDHPATLSPPEVVRAVKALTGGEKTALIKMARLYARKTPYDHEDLVQEAITRVLDRRRLWPVGVSATLFLGGVIRSIAWEWKNELHGEDTDVGDEGVQERGTIARIDIGRIIALFDDDPVAQKIVIGMMDGARGEELQEASGLDQTEYESKRKKIRRRIEKLMP
jgi:hypothetical protein